MLLQNSRTHCYLGFKARAFKASQPLNLRQAVKPSERYSKEALDRVPVIWRAVGRYYKTLGNRNAMRPCAFAEKWKSLRLGWALSPPVIAHRHLARVTGKTEIMPGEELSTTLARSPLLGSSKIPVRASDFRRVTD
jgi:hypothetical protein